MMKYPPHGSSNVMCHSIIRGTVCKMFSWKIQFDKLEMGQYWIILRHCEWIHKQMISVATLIEIHRTEVTVDDFSFIFYKYENSIAIGQLANFTLICFPPTNIGIFESKWLNLFHLNNMISHLKPWIKGMLGIRPCMKYGYSSFFVHSFYHFPPRFCFTHSIFASAQEAGVKSYSKFMEQHWNILVYHSALWKLSKLYWVLAFHEQHNVHSFKHSVLSAFFPHRFAICYKHQQYFQEID